MMRFFAGAALLVSTLAFAAPAAPLLPSSFAGWKETSTAPLAPARAHAAAMQEYGLAQAATAEYGSGGNQVTVRAWQFHDATGAYGAFTFFLQPQMHAAGRDGASAGGHYLVWHGATVIDAEFSHPSPGDRVALDALTAQLPRVEGSASVAPSLPQYLPQAGLDATSVRYAIGPVAYQQMGGALPPGAIGFSEDAEAVTAQYGSRSAQGTLTLILYPTPQIAAAHLKAIEALSKTTGLLTKQSGPLLAVVNRGYPQAKPLLDAVRFKDTVIMNRPQGYVNEAARVAQLLLGIAALTGILILASVLVALFLGGGRALVRKLQGKPVSSVDDEEFISLNLRG
jgi:hypothetical protein